VHVHVFAWTRDSSRLPLSDHARMWSSVLAMVAANDEATRCAYLEFVARDDPAVLQRDAATLLGLIGSLP